MWFSTLLVGFLVLSSTKNHDQDQALVLMVVYPLFNTGKCDQNTETV